MGFKLLPAGDLKKILEEIGKKIVSLHKERIQKQVQVDGSAMPSLRPRTIEMKEKKGGRSKKNATKRMIDTGDFMQNAFQYKVTHNNSSLLIYISKDPHLWRQKIGDADALKRYKKALGRNIMLKKYGRATTHMPIQKSYRSIAMSQESTGFGMYRSDKNVGANFFGLSQNDFLKYRQMFLDMSIPIMKKNFIEYLNKRLKIK